MSGLPSLSTTPASWAAWADFFVEVLLGDREIGFGQCLLQQQVRDFDFEHFAVVAHAGIRRPIPSTGFARR